MRLDLENLPSDISLLHQLVREMAGVVESRDGEIERLQSIIKKLQRAQFGRRSERLDPDQLALALEDLDADIARIRESRPAAAKPPSERTPHRKPLPIICPAMRFVSTSRMRFARAAAAGFMPSAKASPRCSIGFRRSFG